MLREEKPAVLDSDQLDYSQIERKNSFANLINLILCKNVSELKCNVRKIKQKKKKYRFDVMKLKIQNTQNINIHLQMRVFLFRRYNFNQID